MTRTAMTNSICLVCRAAVNCLNGLRCAILERSVEYSKTPPCKETSKSTNKNH